MAASQRPDPPLPSEHAQTEEVPGRRVPVRKAHENATVFEEVQIRGAVVRFEQVRGSGDLEVSRLAELQHGHVHRVQLRAAGLGRGAIANRLSNGRLHRSLPSIYLVGRPGVDAAGREMAAALYSRGDALIAGRTAAERWGLEITGALQGAPVDVLTVGHHTTAVRGVRITRTRELTRSDVRWRNGIPLTSPARTLLDLAGVLGPLDLEAAVASALGQGLTRRSNLTDVMTRNPQAKGIALLRELASRDARPRDTRSTYERKLLELIRSAGLPVPQTNVRVAGHLVDVYWPELQLVAKFDSWTYHRGRAAFEQDRLRDQHLLMAGIRVTRITGRQLDRSPHELVARLATIIAAARLQSA